MRTPQFWLLWVVLFCNVTAGIGILEQAAPMIQDFFRDAGGSRVDAAAAAAFVGPAVDLQHGRPVRVVVDVGRRRAQARCTWATSASGWLLYALLALAGDTSTLVFVVLAGMIISFYGGGFATVPAYLRDLFGTFQVGAIHGRLLTAWAGGRRRRTADRQRLPRRRGDAWRARPLRRTAPPC